MKLMKPFLVVLISAAMIFTSSAQAIEIRQFDRMAGDDQITYIDRLIDSVEAATTGPQLAQVKRFFMAKQPDEAISGMGRFELSLALARIADLDAAEKNPKARRLEVEDVLYVTLEKSGIVLPRTFRPTVANFQPKLPLSQKPLTKEDAVKADAQARAWAARTVDAPQTFRSSSLSGFSDNDKAIAFFVALAPVAVAARKVGGGSGAPSSGGGGIPVDTNPWWQRDGFDTFDQAMHSACVNSSTAAVPDC